MERGSRAALSANEERALRYVAKGGGQPTPTLPVDIQQLKKLGLILEVDGELCLTSMGQIRYINLPN